MVGLAQRSELLLGNINPECCSHTCGVLLKAPIDTFHPLGEVRLYDYISVITSPENPSSTSITRDLPKITSDYHRPCLGEVIPIRFSKSRVLYPYLR